METALLSPPERDNTAVLYAHKVIKNGIAKDANAR